MIDILYVAWNRLEYTKASFLALIENTDWSEVRCLYIKDDGSDDGTASWLNDQYAELNDEESRPHLVWDDRRLGGPVAAMNAYLDWDAATDLDPPVEMFAKIDNDFVVCPGWLPVLLKQMTLNPVLDVLGVEPWFGRPQASDHFARGISPPVEHVGGKGLIRHRVFSHCRPVPGGFNGYQGWTQYQQQHPEIRKAWITPDLPCFGLDQIDLQPYRDLAEAYESKGWGRLWPLYGNGGREYYEWWMRSRVMSQ